MTFRHINERGALRLPDVVILAFVAFALLFVFVQNVGQSSGKSPRIHCLSNTKQVALGFLLWANDNQKPFPMELPVAQGGTKDEKLKHNLVAQYLAISSELGSARVLTCPSDKRRKPAESFTNLTPKNLSYFLNLGATFNSNSTGEIEVLLGDRQITLNQNPVRGYVESTNADCFGWTNWLHVESGNIALDDGSAQQARVHVLRDQLRHSEPGKIRLLVP